MDKIIIKDLEIYGYHGVFPEEAVLGQKFILSLTLKGDFRTAGTTGDLTKGIHYGEVCNFVEKVFLEEKLALIESCGEKICENLLLAYPLLQSVTVQIKKPWAPIGSHLDYAAVELERSRHTAYIGIGSNMGNKEENIQNAIKAMETPLTKVVAQSKHYATKPWGNVEQEDFLNAVVSLETLLTPAELLSALQAIEKDLKRERRIHWGPRTIDLDILLYDQLITSDIELTLPHPFLEQRMFVLEPLAEIAPWVIHPLQKKRIQTLKEELEKAT